MALKREETVLEVVSTCIRAEHLNQLSAVVGQSPAVVGPALAQLLPLVVRTLAERTSRPHGVEFLWELTQQAQTNQVLSQLNALNIASQEGRGVLLLQGLLPDSYETTIARLAIKAGVPLAAYAPLVEVAVAAVLGTLGKYTTQHHLQPTELADWLQSEIAVAGSMHASQPQRSAAASLSAMPRHSGSGNAAPAPTFATRAGQWQEVGGGSIFTPQQAAPARLKGMQRWGWPLLLLLGLALGYGFFRWTEIPTPVASTEPSVPVTYTSAKTQPASVAPTTPASVPADGVPAGHYDSATDTYIYHTGQPLIITLSNGTTLEVGSNSTEYQLYRFLADPEQQVDSLNSAAGWINVDRVYFNSGQSTLTTRSTQQLRNLAAILRTFPRAQLLFGGHTDGSGDGLKNLYLSDARAQAAMRALAGQGISPRRLQAIGYGEATPVAANSGPVGRALNRRLRLKVVNKLGPLLPEPTVVQRNSAPLVAPVAGPVTEPASPTSSPRPVATQAVEVPALAEQTAQSPTTAEPAAEQEATGDSRYRVAVRTAYLFDAPTQVQPTKKYLRKGDILYGEDERNGLVKTSFRNPDGAVTTGWLKLQELQKLSETTTAAAPVRNAPKAARLAATTAPTGFNKSASTVPAVGARAKANPNGSVTAVVRVAKSYFFNSPNLSQPETRKAHCVRGDKVQLVKDGGDAVYVTFTNWEKVTTAGWMRKDALDYN
ncbi:OmpA family protein [Hymenobacter tibetensis]|uniref:OmpA family protein n=1 Tax=Hymenobacter tibetensis TaxID=497967 RepID=A0ABY4D2U4_9BACT|nr:OmpA family protein [Hymenobacter tibetensis]UOG76532.1 OmpA family protein [Hymenobacter tibetensis]